MFTIVHLSDIHFGRIAYPEIIGALIDEVNALAPTLVAVSGDLTQRARSVQFEAARDMIGRFAVPTLVVPGNHDVFAWWHRPALRLIRPLRRFRNYFGDDLMPTFEQAGLAVLGINSAHGRTIKGGRIGSGARARIAEFFEARDATIFKVLVVHHHLTHIQALGPHDVARNARKALEVASEAGVDLILCGHLHISHIEPIEIVPASHRIVIASAGTATSNRGRAAHRDTNFYNVVTVGPEWFEVAERRYEPEVHQFVEERRTRFDRRREEVESQDG